MGRNKFWVALLTRLVMLRAPLQLQLVKDVRAVETAAGYFRHAIVVLIKWMAFANVEHQGMAYDWSKRFNYLFLAYTYSCTCFNNKLWF